MGFLSNKIWVRIFLGHPVHPEFVHFLYNPQTMLSDIKNREVIIKDIESYIYQYFKWSRDNEKLNSEHNFTYVNEASTSTLK